MPILSSKIVSAYSGALYFGRVIQVNDGSRQAQNAEASYMQGLVEASRIKKHAVSSNHQTLKFKDLSEFESWLLVHTSRDLQTFVASDFEAYFPSWCKSHGKHSQTASHSRASKLVSNISTCIDHLERDPQQSVSKFYVYINHASLPSRIVSKPIESKLETLLNTVIQLRPRT